MDGILYRTSITGKCTKTIFKDIKNIKYISSDLLTVTYENDKQENIWIDMYAKFSIIERVM